MPETSDIRFGILLSSARGKDQSDADVLARTLAVTRQADALGIDEVWLTEHHCDDTIVAPSALTLASFLLASTSVVSVGTAVTPLPLHSPVHVAEQAALLDHVSGGRFILGVGRGLPLVEYEVIGKGIDYWHEGLAEALDLTLASWDSKVSADSDLYSFRPVTVVPRPASPGGPPVYVAASSSASVETAASRGLPMLLYFDKDAETKASMVADHASIARDHGYRSYHDHAFALYAQVTKTDTEARDLARRRAERSLAGNKNSQVLLDAPSNPMPTSPDSIPDLIDSLSHRLLENHPIGDVPTCVERIVRNIEVSGATRVLCQVESRPATEAALKNLTLLAEEVLPAVRRRISGEPRQVQAAS